MHFTEETMARKRKNTTNEEPPSDSIPTTAPTVAEEPRQGNNVPHEGIPDQATQTAEDSPGFAGRVAQRNATTPPDPFGIAGDFLAGVRLFESRRDHQMALKFNEKPSHAVLTKLKEAGYRWNPDDMIWTQPVWPATAMSTRIKAERLFQEISQMMREEKGLDTSQEVPF